MVAIVLIPVLLVLFPVVYNLITNNQSFFTDTFTTFGNTFEVVLSSFQMFYDIGTILPGRLYPIYSFAIHMLIACFVIWFFHLVIQILSSIFGFIK